MRCATLSRFPGQALPLVISPEAPSALDEFIAANRSSIEDTLLREGAILFRGFGLEDDAGFARAVAAISDDPLSYVYRSTPRTELAKGVFTATEYPADQEIPLHSENAYQQDWPRKVLFYCAKAAEAGGQTPLAELGKVTEQISPAVLDRFAAVGVEYVRHYHPFVDLPWQVVFQAKTPAEVAAYCAAHDIAWTWLGDNILRTSQVCQGVATHPDTRRTYFFNQAHLFHVSSVGAAADVLIKNFGWDRLPRHARFGDGEAIGAEDLLAVRSAFGRNRVTFDWRTGDVLLLDNMQVAHGRLPYRGERRVLAALTDSYGPGRRLDLATTASRP